MASLPMIKDHFAATDHIDILSKLILTAPALSIVFFAPFSNALAQKFGKKRVLLVAVAVFGFFGMMGGFLHSLTGIIISRLIFGAGVAVIMSVALSLVGDYMQNEERTAYLGFQASFAALGGVLFMSGGGFLSEFSWQAAFYIYGFAFFVLLIDATFLYEPTAVHMKAEQHEKSLHVKRHWPVFLTGFLTITIFYMVPTQLPYLLHDVYGMEGGEVGTLIATVTFVGAITAYFYKRLRHRFSIFKIYTILLLAQAVGFTGISQAWNYLSFNVALIATGIGVGLVLVNTSSWLLERATGSERLKATGILSSCIFLGQFSSPIIVAPLIGYLGVQQTFGFMAILLTLSGAGTIINEMKKQDKEKTWGVQ